MDTDLGLVLSFLYFLEGLDFVSLYVFSRVFLGLVFTELLFSFRSVLYLEDLLTGLLFPL